MAQLAEGAGKSQCPMAINDLRVFTRSEQGESITYSAASDQPADTATFGGLCRLCRLCILISLLPFFGSNFIMRLVL